MAFRIDDLAIHVMPGQAGAPCVPASPQQRPCPGGTCQGSGKPKPGEGKPGGGSKKERHLAALRSQLREALSAPL